MRVDIVRGARDYIRAVDLISGSPLSREVEGFRFAFRHVVHAPGRWVSGRHDADSAATLVVRQQGRSTDWSFLIDDPGTPAQRLPDIREDGLLIRPAIVGNEMVCTLSGGVGLWDQLVAAIRLGGQQLFPDAHWYLIYLQGNANALREDFGGATLSLTLGRRKAKVLELAYALDGVPAGRIGLYAR